MTDSSPQKRRRLKPLAYGAMAGVMLAVGIGLALLFFFARDTTPLLTEDELREAVQRWEAHGPKSYRLEIRVTGTRGGTVEMEVRDELPVSLTRDGRTPPKHTWDFWSVPGQLEAIERELTGDAQTMFGATDRSQVILQAEFDPQLGYPRKYRRQVLGKSVEIGWKTVRFEAL